MQNGSPLSTLPITDKFGPEPAPLAHEGTMRHALSSLLSVLQPDCPMTAVDVAVLERAAFNAQERANTLDIQAAAIMNNPNQQNRIERAEKVRALARVNREDARLFAAIVAQAGGSTAVLCPEVG